MINYDKFMESLSDYPSLIALLLSNFSIILFVLFFKATTMEILLIYWMESAIIGFYNVLKMAIAGWSSDSKENSINIVMKLFLIPFFIVHYGGFMVGHFIFIMVITSINTTGQPSSVLGNLLATLWIIAIPVLILLISHGYSFVYNFLLNKEYKNANLQQLKGQPYSRVVVMHLVIILGVIISTVLMAFFKNLTVQTGIVIFFIVAKTIADVKAHIKERKKMKVPMSSQG